MDQPGPSRKLIIPRGVLERGNNVVEIPESCEDSRVLIAKLQAQHVKPPGYYPPTTNPNYRVERHMGDGRVDFGLPPLSPVREEYSGYEPSLSQYGCSPCPSSTPASPQHSPIDSSMYRSPLPRSSTPQRGSDRSYSMRDASDLISPPRRRAGSPEASDRSYSLRDVSDLVSPPRRARRGPPGSPDDSDRSYSLRDVSDLVSPPRRPRRGPPGSPNDSDRSYSLRDVSDLVSPPRRRGSPPSPCPNRSAIMDTSEELREMSEYLRQADGSVPEELDNSALNESLAELESLEREELRTVQSRVRNFQEARRDMVISAFSLYEADV